MRWPVTQTRPNPHTSLQFHFYVDEIVLATEMRAFAERRMAWPNEPVVVNQAWSLSSRPVVLPLAQVRTSMPRSGSPQYLSHDEWWKTHDSDVVASQTCVGYGSGMSGKPVYIVDRNPLRMLDAMSRDCEAKKFLDPLWSVLILSRPHAAARDIPTFEYFHLLSNCSSRKA